MPRPAPDARYLILTTLDRESTEAAIQIAGGHLAFLSASGVRERTTLYAALALAPISPHIATTIIACADRINATAGRTVRHARPGAAAAERLAREAQTANDGPVARARPAVAPGPAKSPARGATKNTAQTAPRRRPTPAAMVATGT
ncbi:MAG: hypothetical protein WCJ30_22305 [Deltaproteobacteria bacterium]